VSVDRKRNGAYAASVVDRITQPRLAPDAWARTSAASCACSVEDAPPNVTVLGPEKVSVALTAPTLSVTVKSAMFVPVPAHPHAPTQVTPVGQPFFACPSASLVPLPSLHVPLVSRYRFRAPPDGGRRPVIVIVADVA
jgi:hypothetical protein